MPLGFSSAVFAKNIVARLRLAFIFIMLVFFVSFVLNSYLLYVLHKNQSSTIEYSIPSLSRSHHIESQLRELTNAISRLKDAGDTETVNTINRETKGIIEAVTEELQITQETDDVAAALIQELLEQLHFLSREMSSVVPVKLELLKHDSRLADLHEELASHRQDLRDIIDPLRFDLIYSLETQLSLQGDSVRDIDGNLPTVNLSTLELIDEISSKANSAIELSDYLTVSSGDNVNKQTETRIKFVFRAITLSLVYLKPDTAKQSLVPLVKNLYRLILLDNGVVDHVNQRVVASNELTEAELQIQEIVKRVSNWADQHVDQALEDINHSKLAFRKTLSIAVFVSLVSGLFIGLLAVLASYFVVERQINHRMLQLTDSVTKIADDDIDHIVGISGDDEIATIAKALEVFRRNTIELKSSNAELKDFAYAASHDLKSPLRAIQSLAEWIREDAYEFLPPDSKDNLDLLQSRVTRLSILQSDLLQYAQAGAGEVHYEKLDLGLMVGDLQGLLDPDDHYSITFSGQMPIVYTYIVPLKQVVMNLLNNAIKHHDLTTGKIVVEASVQNSKLRISVTDDGPGIDPRYHQTIFKLFKTLKSRDEVEGSGLGLSMVQKIVRRHGGKITVQSNPDAGRGSVFLVVWPRVSFTSDVT